MRVALYARVSTTNGQSPEMQLAELREYSSRRGFKVVGEYVDQGVSGSKESRPQLNLLMADAHRRKFDAVLCWKIDRFGRSLKHEPSDAGALQPCGQEAKRKALTALDNVTIGAMAEESERKE